MRRTIVLSSLVASMVTVLVMLHQQHVLAPRHARAQSNDLQEVRASAFVLVAPDGTVVGRWDPTPASAPGAARPNGGGGKLSIFNAQGTERLRLNPNGILVVYDTDGTTGRFAAGYLSPPVPGPVGNPPVNGLQLDKNATIDYIFPFGSP